MFDLSIGISSLPAPRSILSPPTPAASAPMPIPPEIICKIIRHCVPSPTFQNLALRSAILKPLSLVSSSWTFFAQRELLFQVFTIQSVEDAEALLERAKQHPEFPGMVRGLWIVGASGYVRTPAMEFRLYEILETFTELRDLWVERFCDFDLKWILGLPNLVELSIHDTRFISEADFKPSTPFPLLRHISFSEGPSEWMHPLFTPTLLPSLRTFDIRFGGAFLHLATPGSPLAELISRLDILVAKIEEGIHQSLEISESSAPILWGGWPTSFVGCDPFGRIGDHAAPMVDITSQAFANLKVQHLRLETYFPQDDEAGLQKLLHTLKADAPGFKRLRSLYLPISYRFGDSWDPLMEICERRGIEVIQEELDFSESSRRKSEVPLDFRRMCKSGRRIL